MSNDIIRQLVKLQADFDKEKSNEIFGDLGDHLYSKYLAIGNNIVTFYTYLDKPNKAILCNYLDRKVIQYGAYDAYHDPLTPNTDLV